MSFYSFLLAFWLGFAFAAKVWPKTICYEDKLISGDARIPVLTIKDREWPSNTSPDWFFRKPASLGFITNRFSISKKVDGCLNVNPFPFTTTHFLSYSPGFMANKTLPPTTTESPKWRSATRKFRMYFVHTYESSQKLFRLYLFIKRFY